MDSFNIAEAKAHLSALVDRAASGEEIEIKKRGEPVARLVPLSRPRKGIDFDALRALRSRTLKAGVSGAEIIREMRDSRY